MLQILFSLYTMQQKMLYNTADLARSKLFSHARQYCRRSSDGYLLSASFLHLFLSHVDFRDVKAVKIVFLPYLSAG